MMINHKIKIDLREFIRTGKFDHLKLGMSKDEVLRVFPKPEDWEAGKEFLQSDIWRYGNFELHFNEECLWLIFNDYVDSIDGGDYLDVDKWIFSANKKIGINEFITILLSEKIDFEKTTNSIGQVVLSGIETGICISFDASEEQDDKLDEIYTKLEDDYESAVEKAREEFDPNKFVLTSISITKK